ncbi:Riboflavin transporter MCH5 [Cyphellophora attinorum]|uniref:Riboflavin transporter MCH5 n=1 Tax=Cyphellophora attinorum TaxID=1664694 RepID=A0A0N1H405_9EURO|nr:Riboflavin transporter MCH5 [Phialophora attinorum]KPI39922.1 Riboflavin transporter MCH5 [Phialophora attinorum]
MARIDAAVQDGTEKTPPASTAIPNGGLKAWLQVLGGFFVFFSTFGVTNAFGVFEAYYADGHLGSSTKSSISIIGAIQTFILLASASIAGPLCDHGYFYQLIVAGSFLSCLGMFMTSLSDKYYQVLLAQGICVGLGSGFLFTPSMAVLSTYFSTRRNLAVGVAATGSSIGGIIYPVTFYYLQPQIGYAWACHEVRTLTSKGKKYIDTSIFVDRTFMLYAISMFVGFVGVFIPFFYISNMAGAIATRSSSVALSFLLVMNGVSTFGRLIPGLLADRIGPLNVICISSVASMVLVWCWIPADRIGGLFAFAALYGFFSGAFVSLPSMTTVALSPDLRAIGARMGFVNALAGSGVLLGQPIAGAILESTGSYLGLQCWAASALAVSSILLILARVSKVGPSVAQKA